MANNEDLAQAGRAKKDEFYTQLVDVERELKHYQDQFRGKTVFCNCDDPYESAFFQYFAMNFNFLGLMKLIATSYAGSPVTGSEIPLASAAGIPAGTPPKAACKIEITEVTDVNGDGATNIIDVEYLLKNRRNVLTLLTGDGDFRSAECIALLDEADIVVTNPPFSLFREYVAQLIEHGKQFLILGNQNAVTYREVFFLIKDGKLWYGPSIHSGDREFGVPDDYPLTAANFRMDKNGRKFIRVKGVRWFTNLDFPERHEYLDLCKTYNPDDYPTYTNYPAIEVSRTADIPQDYDGAMGVPITFIDKYNPNQFEILGSSNLLAKPMSDCAKRGTYSGNSGRFYVPNGNGTYRRLYDRIIIQKIGVES